MWDEKYAKEHYHYGKMPNDFLMEMSHQIPEKGKVLSIGDGEGRNSVFLARSGYQVTGIDSSQKGIDKANDLAKENSVNATYICKDLNDFKIEPNNWDGIISIFCHLPQALRQRIHQSIVNGLKPNGVFILESYTPAQLALGTGGPKDIDLLPDLSILKNELHGLKWKSATETNRIIMEGIGHSGPSAVVQMVGVKE